MSFVICSPIVGKRSTVALGTAMMAVTLRLEETTEQQTGSRYGKSEKNKTKTPSCHIMVVYYGMQKTLVIMRGLPGSGKSTAARQQAMWHVEGGGQTVAICSTDSFFVNDDGQYVFDASKLGKHHGMNQYKANQHMFMGTELVIVDNTNTTHKEMEPYKQSAKDHLYEVVEILVGEDKLFPESEHGSQHTFKDYIDMCVGRNTHGVPKEAIERMARRFEQ